MHKKGVSKGVSPLVATLLLLTLAVIIGAIIFSWMKDYTKDSTQEVTRRQDQQFRCDLAVGSLRIVSIQNQPQICYDSAGKTLPFTVENNLDMRVQSLFVRVIDNTGQISAGELGNSTMEPGAARQFSFNYSDTIDRPVQITLIPKDIEGQLCSSAGTTIEEVFPC